MSFRRWLVSLMLLVVSASASFANPVPVLPGDTLWSLAVRHGTSVDALMMANNLRSTNVLPGDRLMIPSSDARDAATSDVAPEDAAEALEDDLPETWTVRPGDTLFSIARYTSLTVEELSLWNGLHGTNILPGDVLELQRPEDPASLLAALDESWLEVQIQAGDSLWRLARAYDTTPGAIAAASGIDVNAVLKPGETLVIPGTLVANANASGDVGGVAPPTVTVDPGDTLWRIAQRYDTTVAALMVANELRDSTLTVGQRLRIVASTEVESSIAAAVAAAAARPTPEEPAPEPEVASNAMVWPIRGAITSRFGWRSIFGGSSMHYGLDIDGDTGDPILAATAGTVVFAGWSGSYGQLIIVENGNHEYYYAHNSEMLVNVGQRVDTGDVIGRVGVTGRTTGSHLHFEIRVDGNPIDPLPILEAQAGVR